jgi:hypothetical protein
VREGIPSAKLGTAAVVSNNTAASRSRSFFMVLVLSGNSMPGIVIRPPQIANGLRLAAVV